MSHARTIESEILLLQLLSARDIDFLEITLFEGAGSYLAEVCAEVFSPGFRVRGFFCAWRFLEFKLGVGFGVDFLLSELWGGEFLLELIPEIVLVL